MKIRERYKIREIAGEYIIVNQGIAGADMTRVISLNSTAKLLFETFSGKDFTVEDVAAFLVEHFSIENELACNDAGTWVKALVNASVIE